MQGFEQVEEEIKRRILEVNPEIFIVEIAFHQGSQSVLSILIDTDEGITIDQCARASRALNTYFEEEDPIRGKFRLEVSSPGVGKPLKIRRQYHKNIGRKLKVSLLEGETVKGKLMAVAEDTITLERPKSKKKKKKGDPDEETTIIINFNTIKEAKVQVSFD